MSEFRWSLDWNTARASGDDQPTPMRRRLGLSSRWRARRLSVAKDILRAARSGHVVPSTLRQGDVRAVLQMVIQCYSDAAEKEPAPCEVAAALDLLDGTLTDLANPDARRTAIVLAAGALAAAHRRVYVPCLTEASARRLDQALSPVLSVLGMTSGFIKDQSGIDERSDGHRSNVVIASAARLAEDALRDRELTGTGRHRSRQAIRRLSEADAFRGLTRGTPVALVDDADLLMLEAPRTIGFGEDPEENAGRLRAEEAFVILSGLKRNQHYIVDPATRRIRLTDAGEERIELAAALFEGPWQSRSWREETIFSALTVRDFFDAGKDYRIEEDKVTLANAPTKFRAEPAISDLVAVKENVQARTRMSRLWTYRQYLSTFGHLSGTGVGLSAFSNDFRALYGLKTRGKSERDTPPTPVFGQPDLSQLPDDAVIWAPTTDDARALGKPRRPIVVADTVFGLEETPKAIVQVAAAPLAWECRLQDVYPDTPVSSYAQATDGIFKHIDPGNADLSAFNSRPSLQSYRAAQNERERVAAERRRLMLKSERYFERILAFAADTT